MHLKSKLKTAVLLVSGAAATAAANKVNETVASADQVTVQSGDTTWDFAQEHGTTVDQIVKDNNLSNGGSLIYVGQTLQINQVDGNSTTEQAEQPAQVETQQVQAQDTSNQSQQGASYSADTNNNATQQNTSNQGQSNSSVSASAGLSTSEQSAKEWIAFKESSGSYTAQNGRYYGRYQLDRNYLNGDFSPANQERTANNYVANRYGSWANAQAFWQSHGWY